MRKWIIATAVLLTVPMVGAAAVIVTDPVQEQLVEGHTVFTVIQARKDNTSDREEFAAAVAVLVQEHIQTDKYFDRFPGVLWFNDQYLVSPSSGPNPTVPPQSPRNPCGAVIAVNQGDVVPLDAQGRPHVPPTAVHNESYRITDPNDLVWDVDKWNYDPDGDATTANGYFIWSVPTLGSGARYGTADDGKAHCGAAADSAGCGTPLFPFVDDTPQRPAGYTGPWPFTEAPAYNDTQGQNPPAGSLNEGRLKGRCTMTPLGGLAASTPPGATGFSYNAVLYFFLDDLTVFGGVKNHSVPSSDVSRCHATANNAWPCPGGDDTAEGNSHPYNQERAWPYQVSEGRGNHGGSSGCGAGPIGEGAQYEHATCNIDVYFGYSQGTVIGAKVYRFMDNEGRTAPYHCHEDMDPAAGKPCNEEEVNSAL